MPDRRKSKPLRRLDKLQLPPPENHHKMTAYELFKALRETGDWTYPAITNEISTLTNNDELGENTVKSWGRRKDIKVPEGDNRDALFELIRTHCTNPTDSEDWIIALIECWRRTKAAKAKASKCATEVRKSVLNSPYLRQLPALFETNRTLPLATAYVDLSLAISTNTATNPTLLELNLSLAEKLEQRAIKRHTVRQRPKDFLDKKINQHTLILGPPGAGKSSLLRRITMEIAQKKWKSTNIPLFVEARLYWSRRKIDPSLNLITFALQNLLPLSVDINQAVNLLLEESSSNKPILLLDGLDEIATDKEAVNEIYRELRQLTSTLPWIVTARPAGVMSSPGETLRCEMVDLDDEAIERLIDNWCKHNNEIPEIFNKESFKTEIFSSSGTNDMARNPFLLTALCYIKTNAPDKKLPVSRVEIYETLFERITLQARRKDPEVLSTQALDALENFSFYLYTESEDGPTQVFSLDHWRKFVIKQNIDVDIQHHVLPSRLLCGWGEAEPYYHFIHLSLHEYQVAKYMLELTPNEVLNRRFIPGWRSVFRFYGALLHHRGKTQEFRKFTQTLYDEEDFNHFYLFILVDIFSYAGIKDTTSWIGTDLRVELEAGSMTGFEFGSNAMIYYLAELDPDYVVEMARAGIEDINQLSKSEPDSKHHSFKGKNFIDIGKTPSSPYEQLARAKTQISKKILHDTFWGDNQKLALMAANAYSLVSTPSDRQKVVKAGENIIEFDDMATRIFAFTLESRRPEFLPFLEKIAQLFISTAKDPFNDVLTVIADINGEKAAKILEKILKLTARNIKENLNAFEISMEAVLNMGGSDAVKILSKVAELPETEEYRVKLSCYSLGAAPTNNTAFLEALSKKTNTDELITSLGYAAYYNRVASDEIIWELKNRLEIDAEHDIYDLVSIESERLNIGREPILCDFLLDFAKHLYPTINEQNENYEQAVTCFVMIFSTLGMTPYHPTMEFVESILFDNEDNVSQHVLTATIDLAGRLLSGTSNLAYLKRLKELLFDEDGPDPQIVALAIGRIDLEELFRLQNAVGANDAIEQLAADNSIMIFEKFWVDQSGNCINWKNPPRKILYICDLELSDTSQKLSHEMSRYGFCLDFKEPDECIACVIFGKPSDEYEKNLETLARYKKQQDDTFLTFNISEKLTYKKARKMAKRIATEIDSIN